MRTQSHDSDQQLTCALLTYQIIRAICRNPADRTVVNLIFANVNEEDILLKKELDELAAKHDNFNVYYVLNNPPAGWTGGVGFVTADMIKEHCPAPSKDMKLLLCGPPPMVKAMSNVRYHVALYSLHSKNPKYALRLPLNLDTRNQEPSASSKTRSSSFRLSVSHKCFFFSRYFMNKVAVSNA